MTDDLTAAAAPAPAGHDGFAPLSVCHRPA
jgi:hypothetical protein